MFFKWAVRRFDRHEDRAEIDEISDDWSLHMGVLEGHLHEGEPSFPFATFGWHHENGNKLSIGWLAIIVEQGTIA